MRVRRKAKFAAMASKPARGVTRAKRKASETDAPPLAFAVVPRKPSEATVKPSNVTIPTIFKLNQLTSSDDAHILLAVEGVTFTKEELLSKKDYDDWTDLQTTLKISHRVVAAIQVRRTAHARRAHARARARKPTQDRLQMWLAARQSIQGSAEPEGWIRRADSDRREGRCAEKEKAVTAKEKQEAEELACSMHLL